MSVSAIGVFGPHLPRLYRHTHVNGQLTVTEAQFRLLLAAHREPIETVAFPVGKPLVRRAIAGGPVAGKVQAGRP